MCTRAFISTFKTPEEQEVVSSLKKFDFLYQASPEEKYVAKWSKTAGEIEDALLKLSNGKEVLLKVAEKRGGEVYVARCPLMFPKLFGEKKRKIEAPKKTEKKVTPTNPEPEKKKAKIARETSDSEFDSDISYHSSDYESCSESESCSDSESDSSCSSDSGSDSESDSGSDSEIEIYSEQDVESDSESDSDYEENDSDSGVEYVRYVTESDSESDSESETDIEQEAWEDLARIERLRLKWEKRKIYAKQYNTSLKAIITRLSKVKDDIEEKDLKKAVIKYINAYRKK
jgi:hypothetical protein